MRVRFLPFDRIGLLSAGALLLLRIAFPRFVGLRVRALISSLPGVVEWRFSAHGDTSVGETPQLLVRFQALEPRLVNVPKNDVPSCRCTCPRPLVVAIIEHQRAHQRLDVTVTSISRQLATNLVDLLSFSRLLQRLAHSFRGTEHSKTSL